LSSSDAQQQLRAAYGTTGQVRGANGTPGAQIVGSNSSDTAGGAPTPGGGAGGTSGGIGGDAGAGAGAGGGGTKAPIVIGMNCNCTGVIGASFAPARDAYQAWVQTINANGGINGHPVKLLVAEDNNSASQDVQNVQQMVEGGGAIALVNFFGASGGLQPVAEYAMKKGIPVVGGSGFEAEWTKYPVMFSTATADEPQDYAWAAEMKAAGKSVVGAIYCAEGAICADKEAVWKKWALQLGLQVKYESKQSLAAPSFSSDCLSASGQGVDALVPIMDGASTARVARDCAQQNYHPLIIASQPFDNPPSYMEGAVAPLASFPWFLTSGTPALDEYGAALSKYVKNALGSYSSLGWSNAKLLEKALTGFVSDTPTSQDVFKGLWALQGDNLGGLTAPLTFIQDQPAPPVKCSFRAAVQGGKWTAPIGAELTDCMP
jgi:branched-chain amino acid transport system substrate-binding protein